MQGSCYKVAGGAPTRAVPFDLDRSPDGGGQDPHAVHLLPRGLSLSLSCGMYLMGAVL